MSGVLINDDHDDEMSRNGADDGEQLVGDAGLLSRPQHSETETETKTRDCETETETKHVL